MGTFLRLTGGLRNLLPYLLTSWHVDVTVLVPEEESILEELLYVDLGGLHHLYLLLHTLKFGHFGGNLRLSLLLLEPFLLYLGFRLPPGR